MAKIVKGSALIDDFGGVTFTPYDNNPAENSPWTVLQTSAFGKLQCSKRKVNLVVTLDRQADVSTLISMLNRQSSQLVASLVTERVRRLYVKSERGKEAGK